MCGFSSSMFNPVGQLLGKSYNKVDPLMAGLERGERAVLNPKIRYYDPYASIKPAPSQADALYGTTTPATPTRNGTMLGG